MDGARVGIFEDRKVWHEFLAEIVEEDGHSVAVSANSMEEARAAIEGLEDGTLDVAVVDGSLDPNKDNGADGAEITRLLREKLGTVTVIGFSASNEVAGVDHNVSKDSGDPEEEILAIIARI